MIKKLVKHGNNWALIIDKDILKSLRINEESVLDINVDSLKKVLIIKAAENADNVLYEVNKGFLKD